MGAALDGIRIVDLSWGVAGPLAVLQLAEQGAEVVKVEPPGGDPFRAHPGYPVWNRSRRSAILDLKNPGGLDAFHRLLETADVLVETFRPGVMERLGLGYQPLHAQHPRLVYASAPGYPRGHRAQYRHGYDALVQARSGQQWEQPGWRDGPVFLHLPMPSMATQFLLQFGITSALLAREQTGAGQHVETSLHQGALAFTTMFWQYLERGGADHHGLMAKTYPPGVHQATIFECADGEWIHAATMNGLQPTASVEELIGMEDAPDFMTLMGMTPEEREAVEEQVAAAYRQQDRDELVDRFHQANLGAEAVHPPEQMFDHAQLCANGTVVEVPDPDHGTSTQVGPVIELFATPGGVVGPQPEAGEHTREVLVELGYGDREIQRLLAGGAAQEVGA